MKVLLFIAVLISFSFSSFAKKNLESGDLKSQFYIRAGLTRPTMNYWFGEFKDASNEDSIKIKRKGGVIEWGSIFMLNSIKLSDGLRIGINADYFSFSWATIHAKFEGADSYSKNVTTLFFGSKVGPSLTYSPVDHLSFDVFTKLNIIFFAPTYTYTREDDDEYARFDDAYSSTAKFRSTFGFNIRYYVLMLGFDLSPGRMETSRWFNDGGSDDADSNDKVRVDNKNPNYTTFSAKVGISF